MGIHAGTFRESTDKAIDINQGKQGRNDKG